MKILPFLILLLTFELTLGCNPELTRKSRQQMLEKKRRGRQVTIPPECNPNIHDDTNSFGPWDCDCKISQAQNQRQIDYGHGLLRMDGPWIIGRDDPADLGDEEDETTTTTTTTTTSTTTTTTDGMEWQGHVLLQNPDGDTLNEAIVDQINFDLPPSAFICFKGWMKHERPWISPPNGSAPKRPRIESPDLNWRQVHYGSCPGDAPDDLLAHDSSCHHVTKKELREDLVENGSIHCDCKPKPIGTQLERPVDVWTQAVEQHHVQSHEFRPELMLGVIKKRREAPDVVSSATGLPGGTIPVTIVSMVGR